MLAMPYLSRAHCVYFFIDRISSPKFCLLTRSACSSSSGTSVAIFFSRKKSSTPNRLVNILTSDSLQQQQRGYHHWASTSIETQPQLSTVIQRRTMSTNHFVVDQSDDEILQSVLDLVRKEKLLCDAAKDPGAQKVVEFQHPKELEKCLGGLEIEPGPTNPKEVQEFLEQVVRYSVKTCHARFYNQLYHGIDTYGLAGSWLSDALNTNNHTFEVAPVFIVVEKALLRFSMEKFGWNTEESDGILAAGGSMSNLYGMVLARYKLMPEAKTSGVFGSKPLVVFTSDESHYSLLKGANWLGLGTDNVVKIPTDSFGRMLTSELETAIRKCIDDGKIPMMVNATSGTTVCGAYDDLNAIADVCEKFEPKIWLHVDACWGGAAILSPKLKHLMAGSDRVDSLAWNAHKMLGAPLQASIFLSRHKGLLHRCNSAAASYLFQQDKFYDVNYDTGDQSVQCGRKVDAFKAWFMIKARGEKFFTSLVENAFDRAQYLAEQIRQRPGFDLVIDPVSCTNVCFTFTPPALRENPDMEKLNKVPPLIKEAMIRQGTLMVGYQPLKHKGLGNFFRMVLHCLPASTDKEMDFVLNEIERLGTELKL